MNDFINVKTAAELICSTPNSVYVLIHKGIIPKDVFFKLGKKKILFSRERLVSWIKGEKYDLQD